MCSRRATEKYDRVEKFAKYHASESLSEIVLISQFEVMIERYIRTGDMWAYSAHSDIDAALPLASVGCEIPLRKDLPLRRARSSSEVDIRLPQPIDPPVRRPGWVQAGGGGGTGSNGSTTNSFVGVSVTT